jgi:hypothetical protein
MPERLQESLARALAADGEDQPAKAAECGAMRSRTWLVVVALFGSADLGGIAALADRTSGQRQHDHQTHQPFHVSLLPITAWAMMTRSPSPA